MQSRSRWSLGGSVKNSDIYPVQEASDPLRRSNQNSFSGPVATKTRGRRVGERPRVTGAVRAWGWRPGALQLAMGKDGNAHSS